MMGPTGTVGPTGTTGQTGMTGATGITGGLGSTGATGIQGPIGATGIQGPPDGPSGPPGPTGATGVQGIQGGLGSTGATGVTGDQGPTGATGVEGPTGPLGASGATGVQGTTGPMGPSGLRGATGVQGATGSLGPTGATGPAGLTQFATTAEMQEGVNLSKSMNPFLTKGAIDFFRPYASELMVTEGTNNSSIVTPLQLAQRLSPYALAGTQIIVGNGLTGGGLLGGDVNISLQFASEVHIQGGSDTTSVMNPLRARQMLDQRPPGIPILPKSSNYTVTATDNGYCVSISSGTLTLPTNLPAGTAITVYNNSSSSRTLTQGASLTLRVAGTTTTGSRTLGSYGIATVFYVATDVAVILGAGLT
jgi:hypothetical protein